MSRASTAVRRASARSEWTTREAASSASSRARVGRPSPVGRRRNVARHRSARADAASPAKSQLKPPPTAARAARSGSSSCSASDHASSKARTAWSRWPARQWARPSAWSSSKWVGVPASPPWTSRRTASVSCSAASAWANVRGRTRHGERALLHRQPGVGDGRPGSVSRARARRIRRPRHTLSRSPLPTRGQPRAAMASATARTRRALSTWRFSIMRPLTVTTPLPVGGGLLERGDDLAGLVDLGLGRARTRRWPARPGSGGSGSCRRSRAGGPARTRRRSRRRP